MKKKMYVLMMTIILCFFVYGFDSLGNQKEYDLTIISEEETPLAPSFTEGAYFVETLVIMIVILFLFLFGIYVFECKKYRNRIYELAGEECNRVEVITVNWNLSKLKRTVKETEDCLADRLLE